MPVSCNNCATHPSPFSPEWKRRAKPENETGCGSGGDRNDCSTPSLADPNSPRGRWEAVHGKLVTRITYGQDAQGHPTVHIQKLACPIPVDRPSPHGSCFFRYRVPRCPR